MDYQLDGKTALVTGSTAGIGLAIAKTLAAEGCHVIINGRTQDRIDAAIDEIKTDHPTAQLIGIAADFGDVAQVNKLINSIDRHIDILVNNVGIFAPRPFVDISDDEWVNMMEVNVMSGVRLSRAFLPSMIEHNWGRIVFISSESGVQIPDEMIHYGVSKTAQIGLSNGIAKLTKGTGVTVNSVLPGSTMSEGASSFLSNLAAQEGKTKTQVEEEFFENVRPNCLLQRFASTQEVANMVTYLCSPLASATNGSTIRVDGGTVPTIL
jgi:NAD(P)-dependent dehydrogenase (short-subunit alcohol dehydrogenase family)